MNITVTDKEFVPTRGTSSAAGLDLYVLQNTFILAGTTSMVDTGVSVEIPENHFGLLCLRSSMGKKGLTLANTIGINDKRYSVTLNRGDRVAQLIIVPYISPEIKVVEELSETVRGDGGFGSTGE
jgi:dUTP pyrophosphatase